jgi:hypothetical protein
MIGAARLDVATYEEVEADGNATGQAMGVVLLASVAAGIGSLTAGGPGAFLSAGFWALVGWAIWAALTYLIGTRLLPEPQTRANVGEMLRTLGFAQAPGVQRVFIGIPGLGALVLFAVSLWMLVAMVVAVRQALDNTSTLRALGVCVVGWIISVIPLLLAVMSGAV